MINIYFFTKERKKKKKKKNQKQKKHNLSTHVALGGKGSSEPSNDTTKDSI
jgi:hypothetical protein